MPFLDHLAIEALDPQRLLDFYVRVLGLAPERAEAWRRGEVPFPSVRINADAIIDFFPPELWAPANQGRDAGEKGQAGRPDSRLNHFCLTVESRRWEAFLATLADKGVAVEIGPVGRWGAHGQAVSVYFHDPEGNYIEARHYPGEDATPRSAKNDKERT